MPDYSDMKSAVELMSGGINTVIIDDVGLPSIMVIIPKMLSSDLISNMSETAHPGFVRSNNTTVNKVGVSKYINTVINDRAYSLPFNDPTVNVSYDDAIMYCKNKGADWTLMPQSLWAAIGLWCRKNNTLPHGNTNNGAYTGDTGEKGIISTENESVFKRTAVGSGPKNWFHDRTLYGIADMVGDVQEWCSGLRVVNGEIQVNSSVLNSDWYAINHLGTLIEPGSENTLKFDLPSTQSSLSIAYQNNPQDFNASTYKKIANITSNIANIWDAQLLKELVLIRPDSSDFPDSYYELDGFSGTKYPMVGGCYYSGNYANIFGISFSGSLNSYKSRFLGFRSAYYGL